MTDTEAPPKDLTAGQVARILRVSSRTIWRQTVAGRLPAYLTLGGQHRYKAADVKAVADQLGIPYEVAP